MNLSSKPGITTLGERVSASASDRLSLTSQIAAAMLVVVLLALGLTTTLNILRFQEAFENLVEQQLDVVAQEVAADLLVGIDLGLSVDAMENLQAIVDRPVQEVPGVAAVAVLDCAGQFFAYAHAEGAAWMDVSLAEAGADGRRWRRFDSDVIAVGLTLTNSYGACAARLALFYPAADFHRTRAVVIESYVRTATLGALFLLPALLLLKLAFWRRERVLSKMRSDLDHLLETNAGAHEKPAIPAQIPKDAERLLGDAYRAARPVLIESLQLGAGGAGTPEGQEEIGPSHQRLRLPGWLFDPVARVLALTALTLLSALVWVSWSSAQTLRHTLLPELAQKGMAETLQAARNVQQALQLGIPLEDLVGVDALFLGLQRNDADLHFLALVDSAQRVVHAAGLTEAEVERVLRAAAVPVSGLPHSEQSLREGYLLSHARLLGGKGGEQTGVGEGGHASEASLYLGHREAALTRPLDEMRADLLIVLLVSLFLTFELMLFVVSLNITLPRRAMLRVLDGISSRSFQWVHGEFASGHAGAIARRLNAVVQRAAARMGVTPREIRDPRLIGVRLLCFLFVFAEELARPIMPIFFGQMASGGLEPSHFGAGMVMALHMAVVALGMPLSAMYYVRLGRRRMYFWGAVLASVGLVGSGLAASMEQLVFFRVISGLGYAATFVACQGFVIEATNAQSRASGMSMMVGGIMLADICGPAIGGILSAWIGHGATFVVGGGIALCAAILVTHLMGKVGDHEEPPPRVTLKAFAHCLRNTRFVALLFFAAVPAKLALSGLLFYLLPLALMEEGADTAHIGRVIMLYGLVGLLSGPLFAHFTDRFQRPIHTVALGALITAAGALPLLIWDGQSWLILAVVALGIGQAMSIPAQVSAALALSAPAVQTHGQGPVMAVLRLLERLGGAAGPLVAAALATWVGVATAMGVFGAYVLLCAFLLLVFLQRAKKPGADGALVGEKQ